MTFISVTHEIGFANRATLMESGRIVEEAPAAAFFTYPAFDRARRFLRSIVDR